jgi:hypothetical protein
MGMERKERHRVADCRKQHDSQGCTLDYKLPPSLAHRGWGTRWRGGGLGWFRVGKRSGAALVAVWCPQLDTHAQFAKCTISREPEARSSK